MMGRGGRIPACRRACDDACATVFLCEFKTSRRHRQLGRASGSAIVPKHSSRFSGS
jgi:hypothetical protein